MCTFDLIMKEGNEKNILLNVIPHKQHPLLGLETFHFGSSKKYMRIYVSKMLTYILWYIEPKNLI